MKTWLKLSAVILVTLIGCSRREGGESGFQPLGEASHNNLVMVLSSMTLNGTGKVANLHLTTGTVTAAEHPVSSNAGLRYFPGRQSLYVVNRFGSDSIQAFFLNGLRSSFLQLALPGERERELENSFEDIWVNSGETFGYVSRLNGTKLLKVDLANRKVIQRIDLSKFADEDGMPEMSRLFEDNGKVLVQLQRLERKGNLWPPAEGGSTLVKIDAETGEVEGAISTVGPNPFTDFAKGSDGRIYYGTSGEWDKVCATCGVESVSLSDNEAKLRFSENWLEGKIVTFALGTTDVFAIIHPSGAKGTQLIAVDTDTSLRTTMSTVPYVEEYQSVAYDKERKLLFAGRKSQSQPVIEIWNTEKLMKVNEFKTDLAPVQLILVP